uniref:G-protein coupled receptors family 1 profile domain-containing protein n=1 Tax=Phlebotomus papatasi TaxID=29031 RepID=A0A1B0D5T3_PHLPP
MRGATMHLQGLSHWQVYHSTLEALTKSGLILVLGVAIVASNILIIATFLNFRGPSEVINYYLLSLAVADLLCGLLIVPLSVYPALTGEWIYGDILCRFIGYLEVTLWSVTVYTFMWISIDIWQFENLFDMRRFKRKPAMLCCPPLLGFNKAQFDEEAYVCMLKWGNMAAYSATLAILVLGPSVISIVHNYGYIFIMMRRLKSGAPIHDKEYATALAENLANPSHTMSFALIFSFWISWSPLIVVKVYESITGEEFQNPLVHFGIVWFGVLNSLWKFIILTGMSPHFRLALRIFCLTICCKTKGRLQAELIGLDPDD